MKNLKETDGKDNKNIFWKSVSDSKEGENIW